MTFNNNTTKAKPVGISGTSSKKAGKEVFSIEEIIRCFNLCLSSTPLGTTEQPRSSVVRTRSGHAPATPSAAADNKSITKAASIAAATKTITAAADALSELPSPKRRQRIPRRSIVSKGSGSLMHSPVASFYSKRSSITMTLNKAFPPINNVSSGVCTIPECSSRRQSQSKPTSNAMTPSEKSEISFPPLHLPKASLPSQPKYAVYLRPYLDGFRELCKLLRHFGSTMSFVIDNLVDILKIMDFHMKSERRGHYEHVEMMIKYETTYKLVLRKIGGKDSGTKSILLLHRSQAFLLEFIKGLKNANHRSKSSAIAQQAFDSSIAKYYNWLINQMASMAFSSLPPTQDCLSRMGNGDAKNAPTQLKKMLDSISPVYNRVQEIYSRYRQLKCA